MNFEDVLTQLDQQRQEMEKAKEEAERLRRETEKQKEKSDEYYAQIKQGEGKRPPSRPARRPSSSSTTPAAGRSLRRAQAAAQKKRRIHPRLQRKAGRDAPQPQRGGAEAAATARAEGRPEATRAIRVGDTVELLKLGTKASVLAINKDGSYQLRAGIMQTAKPDEVYLLENETQNAAKRSSRARSASSKPRPSRELDIRGMAVDEALPVLDNFPTRPTWEICRTPASSTAKGTGVLRSAVQEELRRCKYVKSFRLGVYGEGESGVTIVEFKNAEESGSVMK